MYSKCAYRTCNKQKKRYHPETDISRPGIELWPPRWEASTQAKSYSNSVLAIRKIYTWASDKILFFVGILKTSVPDPWHFGVDPDPRIHASD